MDLPEATIRHPWETCLRYVARKRPLADGATEPVALREKTDCRITSRLLLILSCMLAAYNAQVGNSGKALSGLSDLGWLGNRSVDRGEAATKVEAKRDQERNVARRGGAENPEADLIGRTLDPVEMLRLGSTSG